MHYDALMEENYSYSSIHELSNLIRDQRVSPVAIVNACLKRIEELNPKLHAFITVLADQAVKQATAGIKTTGAFEPLESKLCSRGLFWRFSSGSRSRIVFLNC
jgi:Asp-tRNA(Asn)/Glu-tRNA(Gln) amidotransferase A subunit family amidase